MSSVLPEGLARTRESLLPSGWRSVSLDEICRVVGGSTPASSTPEYWGGDVVWITPTDLGRLKGVYISSSERHITSTGYASSGTELVPPGTVILSSRAPIGYLGISMVPLCTNQGCKSLVPGPNIDSRFLYFTLLQAIPALRQLGSGATFSEVSKSQIEKFRVSIPPLAEQKRIAAALTEQMAAVERARAAAEAQLEAAELLRMSCLRSLFYGRGSTSWPWTTVEDLSSLIIDGPHVTPFYRAEGIPFVTVRNIVRRRIDFTGVSFISESDHRLFSSRGKAELGDILYTKDGTLGIPCVVDTDREFSFFVSVALIKLRRDLANPQFVAYALQAPSTLDQVKLLGAGAGLKHMVLKSIRSLRIPLPPLIEQERLARVLGDQMESVERLRFDAATRVTVINALPAALLRGAFSGELWRETKAGY